MGSRWKDVVGAVNDIVLVASAVLSIAITLLDFLGVLDRFPWLSERVPILTLLTLSLLLVSVVIERRTRLDVIHETLSKLMSTYAIGARYLENGEDVTSELERVARRADDSIMALGGRSRATGYLSEIENAVLKRNVSYHRLIDGGYITHQLHEHLTKLLHSENVQMSWTPADKFGNLTVTDKECVLVLPTEHPTKFSGLLLPGPTNGRRYEGYFRDVLSRSVPVPSEKGLQVLCESCGKDSAGNLSAGNVDEIQRVLQAELKNATKAPIRR